jgi:hypothetical protein
MAVLKFTNSKSSLKKLAQYITSDEKTEDKLISGKDCMAASAYDEMITVKQMFGKRSGRQYIHLVQSFDVRDQVSYRKAHEVGRELAELFTGFQVLLATHKDRRHVHNHLLINSVNFETGLKYQQSKEDMQNIKSMSDYLCREAGLSVIEHKGGEYISRAEYKAAEKGESWKFRLMGMIDSGLAAAKTKEGFILFMELHGYGVKWMDSRSSITYTTPEGLKCRDDKLHDKKYIKEEMENGFIQDGHVQSSEPAEKRSIRSGRGIAGNHPEIGGDSERDGRFDSRNQKDSGQQRIGFTGNQHIAGTDQSTGRKNKRIVRPDDRSR